LQTNLQLVKRDQNRLLLLLLPIKPGTVSDVLEIAVMQVAVKEANELISVVVPTKSISASLLGQTDSQQHFEMLFPFCNAQTFMWQFMRMKSKRTKFQ